VPGADAEDLAAPGTALARKPGRRAGHRWKRRPSPVDMAGRPGPRAHV